MARPGAFLEELGRVRDATRVFVAGHLPHVEALAGMVITKGGKAAIAVENGGLLRLDLPDPGRAEGVLRWYLAPAHLADLAKG
jgi:phosphohistidine phosphatase SixA